MKKTLLLTLLFISTILYSQSEYKTADYQSFEKANTIFSQLEQLNYNEIDTIQYSLHGTWHFLGHYALPRQRRDVPFDVKVRIAQNDFIEGVSSYIDGKKTATQTEYFSEHTVYIIPYNKAINLVGEHLHKQSDIPFYSPVSVYEDMKKNKSSLRYIGDDEKTVTLSYNSSFLRQVAVDVDKASSHISSVRLLKYDDLEGDYFMRFEYQDYLAQSGLSLPQKLSISEWDQPLMSLAYDSIQITHKTNKNPLAGYSLKKIANNLYLITLPTGQHQSFVTYYGDYLGIIEIPINEVYAKHIVDFVKQNFPDKPIKYAFLTHHHPDHAGGFTYCYKNGMDVVTTPISHQYQLELLEKKHLLRDEKIEYTQDGNFTIIPSLAKKDFSNDQLTMVAYEMGENSHTKEFILYYFPAYKILIVGDLYYSGEKIYPSERASDILYFIEKNELEVEKCYQTWGWEAKEFSTIDQLKQAAQLFRVKNTK